MKKKFCIIVPAYRKLTVTERAALVQIAKTLKDKTNVFLMRPERLDISEHMSIFPEMQDLCLDDKWFESTATYSQLLVRDWFYKMFSQYEYMVILQLDVWLVKDDISEWCDRGYDYIGAPIQVNTAGWHNFRVDAEGNTIVTPKIGNGGFSLRKIDTFIELTDLDGYIAKRYNITEETISRIIYEDLWFCDVLAEYYDLERPGFMEAFKFAMDMNPDITENNFEVKELPTGIHAFDKNIPFWKERIPELAAKDIYDCSYEAHKNFIDTYYYRDKK